MTRVIGLIFILVVLVFGLTFGIMNAESVQIDYYFGIGQMPLSLILVIAFVVGALFGAVVNVGMILKLKRQIFKLRKEVRVTEKEVRNLRALPIKDKH